MFSVCISEYKVTVPPNRSLICSHSVSVFCAFTSCLV